MGWRNGSVSKVPALHCTNTWVWVQKQHFKKQTKNWEKMVDFCEFGASLIYIVRLWKKERKRERESERERERERQKETKKERGAREGRKREGKETQQQNAGHRRLVLVTMKIPRPRQLFWKKASPQLNVSLVPSLNVFFILPTNSTDSDTQFPSTYLCLGHCSIDVKRHYDQDNSYKGTHLTVDLLTVPEV